MPEISNRSLKKETPSRIPTEWRNRQSRQTIMAPLTFKALVFSHVEPWNHFNTRLEVMLSCDPGFSTQDPVRQIDWYGSTAIICLRALNLIFLADEKERTEDASDHNTTCQ